MFDFRDHEPRYLSFREDEKFGSPSNGYNEFDEWCPKCGRSLCKTDADCIKAQIIEKEQIDDIEGLSGEEEQKVLEGLKKGRKIGQPLQTQII